MNTVTFLVFGLIIGVVYVDGNRVKRNFNQYCTLQENIRTISWNCIEKFLPADEKEMYQTITSCFDKTSFEKVLNMFCGKTGEERFNFVMEHIHCFQQVDLTKFSGGPTVDLEKTAKCVADAIQNE